MAHADDLIQPQAQKIALIRCRAALSAASNPSRQITSALRESRIEFWAKNSACTITFRQLTASAQNRFRFNSMPSQFFTDVLVNFR
jgi:hypothetical protein